jgi:hypothetical protein
MNILKEFYISKPNTLETIAVPVKKIKENFQSNTLAVIADWDRTLTCTNTSSWILP